MTKARNNSQCGLACPMESDSDDRSDDHPLRLQKPRSNINPASTRSSQSTKSNKTVDLSCSKSSESEPMAMQLLSSTTSTDSSSDETTSSRNTEKSIKEKVVENKAKPDRRKRKAKCRSKRGHSRVYDSASEEENEQPAVSKERYVNPYFPLRFMDPYKFGPHPSTGLRQSFSFEHDRTSRQNVNVPTSSSAV
ncbi:eukaryotic translation initiation factor 5B-like [Dendronephthya gigantea]|uniref:eukaryotic translation initiation factor 5B-like n=1 Tax=Dendronephthya gigantea TaxID=151771 RepID=UPI00106B22AB|nr:eukaryotic translation initiation factor 5B-like [Dendronephthya gigantea]